jgi:hypothetical protein
MTDVSFTIDFGRRRQRLAVPPTPQTTRPGRAAAASIDTGRADVTTAARTLALAHYIDREIKAGRFKGCKDAGTRLGICESRVNQVMWLLFLPPAVQAAVLLNARSLSERALRELARTAEWPELSLDATDRAAR